MSSALELLQKHQKGQLKEEPKKPVTQNEINNDKILDTSLSARELMLQKNNQSSIDNYNTLQNIKAEVQIDAAVDSMGFQEHIDDEVVLPSDSTTVSPVIDDQKAHEEMKQIEALDEEIQNNINNMSYPYEEKVAELDSLAAQHFDTTSQIQSSTILTDPQDSVRSQIDIDDKTALSSSRNQKAYVDYRSKDMQYRISEDGNRILMPDEDGNRRVGAIIGEKEYQKAKSAWKKYYENIDMSVPKRGDKDLSAMDAMFLYQNEMHNYVETRLQNMDKEGEEFTFQEAYIADILGRYDEVGLEYYQRGIDKFLEAGIIPSREDKKQLAREALVEDFVYELNMGYEVDGWSDVGDGFWNTLWGLTAEGMEFLHTGTAVGWFLNDEQKEALGRSTRKGFSMFTMGWTDPYASFIPPESKSEAVASTITQATGMIGSFMLGGRYLGGAYNAIKGTTYGGALVNTASQGTKAFKANKAVADFLKVADKYPATSQFLGQASKGIIHSMGQFGTHTAFMNSVTAQTWSDKFHEIGHQMKMGALFGSIGAIGNSIRGFDNAVGKLANKGIWQSANYRVALSHLAEAGLIYHVTHKMHGDENNPYSNVEGHAASIFFSLMHTWGAAKGSKKLEDNKALVKENQIEILQMAGKLTNPSGRKMSRKKAEQLLEEAGNSLKNMDPQLKEAAKEAIKEFKISLAVDKAEKQFLKDLKNGEDFNVEIVGSRKEGYEIHTINKDGLIIKSQKTKTKAEANKVKKDVLRDLSAVSADATRIVLNPRLKSIEEQIREGKRDPETIKKDLKELRTEVETEAVWDANSEQHIGIHSTVKNEGLKKIRSLEKKLKSYEMKETTPEAPKEKVEKSETKTETVEPVVETPAEPANYSTMKMADLKKQLVDKGLSAKGKTKKELIERLESSDRASAELDKLTTDKADKDSAKMTKEDLAKMTSEDLKTQFSELQHLGRPQTNNLSESGMSRLKKISAELVRRGEMTEAARNSTLETSVIGGQKPAEVTPTTKKADAIRDRVAKDGMEATLKNSSLKELKEAYIEMRDTHPDIKLDKPTSQSKEAYLASISKGLEKIGKQGGDKPSRGEYKGATKTREIKYLEEWARERFSGGDKQGGSYNDSQRFVKFMEDALGLEIATKKRLKDLNASERKQLMDYISNEISPTPSAIRAMDRLKKNLKDSMNTLNSGIDPVKTAQNLKDLTIVGADMIRRGAIHFGRFSSKMIKEFGEAIKPHLRNIYEAAKDYIKNPKIGLGIEVVDFAAKAKDKAWLKKTKKIIAENEVVPEATLVEVADVLSSRVFLETKKDLPQFKNIEALSRYLTKRTRDLQEALGINLRIDSPKTNSIVARVLAHELIAEGKLTNNASGWYSTSMKNSIEIIKGMYPELKNPQNETAFKFGLAITSNGKEVGQNLRLAIREYEYYKKHGRFNEKATGGGTEQPAMNQAYKLYNSLAEAWGEKTLHKFLNTEMTVRELNEVGVKKITGELKDNKVLGSTVFGPKIGGAFYANVIGRYDVLTMDRHFVRNIERIIGNLLPDAVPTKGRGLTKDTQNIQYGTNLAKFKNAIRSNASARKKYGITKEVLKDDMAMIEIARQIHKEYAKGGFTKKTGLNLSAKGLDEMVNNPQEAPRSGGERNRYRKIMEEVVEIAGASSVADAQAILWFPQKRLYGKFGIGGKSGKETNYELEARKIANERGIDDTGINRLLGGEQSGKSVKSGKKTNEKTTERGKNLEQLSSEAFDRLVENGVFGQKNFFKHDGPNKYTAKDKFNDIVTVGAEIIRKGADNFQKFGKEMLNTVGGSVKPYLSKIYQNAKKMVSNPFPDSAISKRLKKFTLENWRKKKYADAMRFANWGEYFQSREAGKGTVTYKEIRNKALKKLAVIKIIEKGLIEEGIVNSTILARVKKNFFGVKSLGHFLKFEKQQFKESGGGQHTAERMDAYLQWLGTNVKMDISVSIGGRSVPMSSLIRSLNAKPSKPNPIQQVIGEMPGLKNVKSSLMKDITLRELANKELRADATLLDTRTTQLWDAVHAGTAKGVGAFKNAVRRFKSQRDYWDAVQQKYGVRTYDAYVELMNAGQHIEVVKGQWMAKMDKALAKVGKTGGESWIEFLVPGYKPLKPTNKMTADYNTVTNRLHNALKAGSKKGLNKREKAAYDVMREYYDNPLIQKAYKTMRFMEYYEGTRGVAGGAEKVSTIQLANGDIIYGHEVKLNKKKDGIEFKNTEGVVEKYKLEELKKVNDKAEGLEAYNIEKSMKKLSTLVERGQQTGDYSEFFAELEKTPGLLVGKNYVPEFIPNTNYNIKVKGGKNVNKNFLRSKQLEKSERSFDAIRNFERKMNADLKYMFQKSARDTWKSMYEQGEKGRLPKEVTELMERSMDVIENPSVLHERGGMGWWERSIFGKVIRTALNTFPAWVRNYPQRWTSITHYSFRDMPFFLEKQVQRTFGRGAFAKPELSKEWQKIPDDLKEFFTMRVLQEKALTEEFVYNHQTKWLNYIEKNGGKGGVEFSQTLRKVLDMYTGVDAASRFQNFMTAHEQVMRMLNSGKSFTSIRHRMFWDHIPKSLKDNLRFHLDKAWNKETSKAETQELFNLVAKEIAGEMVSSKWQYRYGQAERSMYETSAKGSFALKLINYARSHSMKLVDGSMNVLYGFKNLKNTPLKDVGGDKWRMQMQKTFSGMKEVIGTMVVADLISQFFWQPVTGREKDEYDPWRMGNMIVGLDSIYPFAQSTEEFVAPAVGFINYFTFLFNQNYGERMAKLRGLHNFDKLTRYEDTGSPFSEYEAKKEELLAQALRDVERMPMSYLMWYKTGFIWTAEAIGGFEGDLKPITALVNKAFNDNWDELPAKKKRDIVEQMQHWFFGADRLGATGKPVYKYEEDSGPNF